MEPITDPREQRREWREQRRQWRHERRMQRREWAGQHGGLIPGVILVGAGALFFLNNLHIVYLREWFQYWPVILVAAGIVKLVDSTDTGGRATGGVAMGIGTIWLAKNLGYLDFRFRDMWPLVLIAIGLLMLFERAALVYKVKIASDIKDSIRSGMADGWDRNTYAGNRLHLSAVFSGGKRKIVAQDFQGGTISAVFGGYEIDLSKADIAGDEAVLHVDTVFGGAEIKIPEHWRAEVRGTGVFGGYSDETHPPDSVHYPNPKRLIVKGAAVFGGVVVKN